jgi:hypothetical protein
VRGTATTIESTGASRETERLSIERSSASTWATDVGGRHRELHAQGVEQPEADRAGQHGEDPPERRARDPLQRLLLVRVTLDGGVESGMIQCQRDADEAGPLVEDSLELEREPPAGRAARFEEGVGVDRALRLHARRGDERRGTAVEEGLRRRDHDHRVGLDERRVDAEPRRELDEAGILDVVDDHASREPARELVRDEAVHLPRRDPPGEAAGDEERLAVERDPGFLELRRRRLDGPPPRVELGSRDRQRRRLDDDRRLPAGPREALQRRAAERVAQRLPDRRSDVRDRVPRRRRKEHDGVVRRGEDLDARSRQQRDPAHGA